MVDIFISYASEDKLRVEPIAKAIAAQGWTVWWDRVIPAGTLWHEEIGKALNTAKVVIVVWSATSINSRWVREEARMGIEQLTLVPIFIDDVPPPLGFGSVQGIDISRWKPPQSSPEFKKLISDISAILNPSQFEEKEEEDIQTVESQKLVKTLPKRRQEAEQEPRKQTLLKGQWKIIVGFVVAIGIMASGLFFLNENSTRKVNDIKQKPDQLLKYKEEKSQNPPTEEFKKKKEIQKELQVALKKKEEEALELYIKGSDAYKNNQFKKAISLFSSALKIIEVPSIYRFRGTCYMVISNLDLAEKDYERSLFLYKNTNDIKGEGISLGNIGSIYSYRGEYQKAKTYYEMALKNAQKTEDRKNEGNHFGNLGIVYDNLGEYEKARNNFNEALGIAKEVGDQGGEGYWLGNLGSVCYSLGEYSKAEDYYTKALVITQQIVDLRGKEIWLGHLGIVYEKLGQYEKAKKHHQEAYDIAKKIGDRQSEGNHLGNLGSVYYKLGQYQKALEKYQEAYNIAREIEDRSGQGKCLDALGKAYSSLGQKEKAKNHYTRALKIFEEIKSPSANITRKNIDTLEEKK